MKRFSLFRISKYDCPDCNQYFYCSPECFQSDSIYHQSECNIDLLNKIKIKWQFQLHRWLLHMISSTIHFYSFVRSNVLNVLTKIRIVLRFGSIHSLTKKLQISTNYLVLLYQTMIFSMKLFSTSTPSGFFVTALGSLALRGPQCYSTSMPNELSFRKQY